MFKLLKGKQSTYNSAIKRNLVQSEGEINALLGIQKLKICMVAYVYNIPNMWKREEKDHKLEDSLSHIVILKK